MSKSGAVYIMSSVNRRAIYTGATSDLKGRVWEHKNRIYPNSFTARYSCVRLVYFELYDSIGAANDAERKIKGGSRAKKIALINGFNPEWKDLWNVIMNW
ncbi:MAG: GIY-YIG nuclease family protein [Chitinophagales bacterium]|nr:GIY-YIG nuclease family protein [Chitinophagales bacterium]